MSAFGVKFLQKITDYIHHLLSQTANNRRTVKPVYKGHPRGKKCPLLTGGLCLERRKLPIIVSLDKLRKAFAGVLMVSTGLTVYLIPVGEGYICKTHQQIDRSNIFEM